MKTRLVNFLTLGTSSLLLLMSFNVSATEYDIQEYMNDGYENDAGMIDFNDDGYGDASRDSRFYIGAGVGISKLGINNEFDRLVTVDEDQDTAFEGVLGYSFNDNFKLEGYYAKLGEASLVTPATNPNLGSYGNSVSGTLDYSSIGLSGIFAYPILSSLDLFAKAGYSKYDLNGEGLGNYVAEDNNGGVHLGVGAEYALSDNLGLRLAYNVLDKNDAEYLTGNIVYYFGGAKPVETIEPIAPVVTPQPPEKKLTDLAKNVYFITNKTQLTTSAKRALNDAASVLKDHSYLNVTVGAHTDSRASDSYNQNLSDGRARSVVDYLIGAGVSPSRMASRGFGESRPIASNDTAEGRAQNRRVEIRTVK